MKESAKIISALLNVAGLMIFGCAQSSQNAANPTPVETRNNIETCFDIT